MDPYDRKQIMIIGGTSGLGLAIARQLLNNHSCERVVVTGRWEPRIGILDPRLEYIKQNLSNFENWDFATQFDVIIFCAGIGRIGHFNELNTDEIVNTMQINSIAPIIMINKLSDKLISSKDFRLAVITSVSAKLVSPLFSVYSATKSCISSYIQSVNVELEKLGTKNRITEIAPGYIEGTGFYKKQTQLELLDGIADKIIEAIFKRQRFIIPENSDRYEEIIKECNDDNEAFGSRSYDYKIAAMKKRKV